MTGFELFLYGFAGSIATEIVAMYHFYLASELDSRRRHILPSRYRRAGFWIIRFLLAIIAGGLAVAYEIDKPLLAINIGAATPLILQALGQGLKNPIQVSDSSKSG
jgi:hypothetical protein